MVYAGCPKSATSFLIHSKIKIHICLFLRSDSLEVSNTTYSSLEYLYIICTEMMHSHLMHKNQRWTFWHELLSFGNRRAMTLVATISVIIIIIFFFYFSHIRSAQVKKHIFLKLIGGSNNLRFYLSSDPIGHSGTL